MEAILCVHFFFQLVFSYAYNRIGLSDDDDDDDDYNDGDSLVIKRKDWDLWTITIIFGIMYSKHDVRYKVSRIIIV